VRIAIYSRVSTTGKGQDTEGQARELREYAARRDWTIVEEFSDSGVSGAKEAVQPSTKCSGRRSGVSSTQFSVGSSTASGAH
jgi:DNA invertase Pin-like site-specific DNA recombinase